jgi:hypothetical protein
MHVECELDFLHLIDLIFILALELVLLVCILNFSFPLDSPIRYILFWWSNLNLNMIGFFGSVAIRDTNILKSIKKTPWS